MVSFHISIGLSSSRLRRRRRAALPTLLEFEVASPYLFFFRWIPLCPSGHSTSQTTRRNYAYSSPLLLILNLTSFFIWQRIPYLAVLLRAFLSSRTSIFITHDNGYVILPQIPEGCSCFYNLFFIILNSESGVFDISPQFPGYFLTGFGGNGLSFSPRT